MLLPITIPQDCFSRKKSPGMKKFSRHSTLTEKKNTFIFGYSTTMVHPWVQIQIQADSTPTDFFSYFATYYGARNLKNINRYLTLTERKDIFVSGYNTTMMHVTRKKILIGTRPPPKKYIFVSGYSRFAHSELPEFLTFSPEKKSVFY